MEDMRSLPLNEKLIIPTFFWANTPAVSNSESRNEIVFFMSVCLRIGFQLDEELMMKQKVVEYSFSSEFASILPLNLLTIKNRNTPIEQESKVNKLF
jgi:hypothetical protein